MPRGRPFPGSALALTVVLHPAGALQVAVDVSALASIPPRQLHAMQREAGALWQPYGVTLQWTDSAGGLQPSPGAPVVLRVSRVEATGPSAAPGSSAWRLGAVLFLEGRDLADSTIALSPDAVGRTIAQVTWAGRRVADWSPAVRDELFGRALGRVLAHEIGHCLLVWRTHTPGGLMRTSFAGDLLVRTDRGAFRLSEHLRPRLRARIAQLLPPGSAVAGIR